MLFYVIILSYNALAWLHNFFPLLALLLLLLLLLSNESVAACMRECSLCSFAGNLEKLERLVVPDYGVIAGVHSDVVAATAATADVGGVLPAILYTVRVTRHSQRPRWFSRRAAPCKNQPVISSYLCPDFGYLLFAHFPDGLLNSWRCVVCTYNVPVVGGGGDGEWLWVFLFWSVHLICINQVGWSEIFKDTCVNKKRGWNKISRKNDPVFFVHGFFCIFFRVLFWGFFFLGIIIVVVVVVVVIIIIIIIKNLWKPL